MERSPSSREVDIFLDAVDLPTGARTAYIVAQCGDDAGAIRRVEGLLAAHEEAEGVFEELEERTLAHPTEPAPIVDEFAPGVEIGNRYVLERELAAGGFGSVWLAEQRVPLKRRVAIKVLKPGIGGREVIARFAAERQALALMDHPGIAKVFDAGATPNGRPFFVMEFVEGLPITNFCSQNALGLRARLDLFRSTCLAVQHAHQKGVIHRDIKPSNVLVTVVDGVPVAKVIDFGIAKGEGRRLTDMSVVTGAALIGTPAYMSPEQADGAMDVDTRTDVYSLGVLLYEIVCDTPPFGSETFGQVGLSEALRLIRQVHPLRPSTRLTRQGSALTRRYGPRQVRGDLDWVVMRCLEKDRDRRYGSVATIANEVERYLDGQPVMAGPPEFGYRASKFIARNRVPLGVSALIALAMLWATLFAWSHAGRATEEAQRAQLESARYAAVADFLERVFATIDPRVAMGADTALLHATLRRAAKDVDALEGSPPAAEATLRRVIGSALVAIAKFEEAEPQLRRALALREATLGDRAADTLQSHADLGSMLLRTERVADAAPHVEACWQGRSRTLAPDAEGTLEALSLLAWLRQSQDRSTESITLWRQLLAASEAVAGPHGERTLRARNNLACELDDAGHHEEALQTYTELLAAQRAVHGDRHPDTLSTLNNLAEGLRNAGRGAEAIPLLQSALAVKREVLPASHPSLIIGLNNLAGTLENAGQPERAAQYWDEALQLAQTHHGERSRLTLQLRTVQVRRLNDADDPRAMQQIGPLVEAVEGALGPDHVVALAARSLQSNVLIKAGQFEKATHITRGLIATAERVLPAGDPAHAGYQLQLGRALIGLGRDDEARRTLEAALSRPIARDAERLHGEIRAALAGLDS